jgi:preprotein translocase SecF subunit
MYRLKLVPEKTAIPFVRFRHIAVGFSLVIVVAAFVMMFTKGFNFGIDFKGGTVIEIATTEPADLTDLRARLGKLDIGEVQLQRFGDDHDVLIRVGAAEGDEDIDAGKAIVEKVKAELGSEVDYRRIESVGPQVSGELIRAATLAVLVSVAAMFAYIWFRFEWQFGLGAVLSIVHDVMATILVLSAIR